MYQLLQDFATIHSITIKSRQWSKQKKSKKLPTMRQDLVPIAGVLAWRIVTVNQYHNWHADFRSFS